MKRTMTVIVIGSSVLNSGRVFAEALARVGHTFQENIVQQEESFADLIEELKLAAARWAKEPEVPEVEPPQWSLVAILGLPCAPRTRQDEPLISRSWVRAACWGFD